MTRAGICLVIGLLAMVVVSCGAEAPAPTSTPQTVANPPTPTPRPPATSVLLDMAVWDDTQTRPPRQAEVWVRGHGSWFPALGSGGDSRTFGTYPVGEQNEFFVYPDGRTGREIRVKFQMTAGMISGSTRARMSIAISDTSVVVNGEAIPGIEQTYQR